MALTEIIGVLLSPTVTLAYLVDILTLPPACTHTQKERKKHSITDTTVPKASNYITSSAESTWSSVL